jgi:hypothetical protein
MSDKIYIITAGDYSDYHIVTVFSTKELAEAYIERWGKGYDARIEEWNVDGVNPYQHPHLDFFRVGMWSNGDLMWSHPLSPPAEPLEDQIYPTANGRKYIYVYCWARDEQHAIKIANERRTRAIAEGRM